MAHHSTPLYIASHHTTPYHSNPNHITLYERIHLVAVAVYRMDSTELAHVILLLELLLVK